MSTFLKKDQFYLLCALFTKPLESKKKNWQQNSKVSAASTAKLSRLESSKILSFPNCFVFEDVPHRYLIV